MSEPGSPSAAKERADEVCASCGHTRYYHSVDVDVRCEGDHFVAPGSFVACECQAFVAADRLPDPSAKCECGHTQANHEGWFHDRECSGTVYTVAPLGGGGCYPCPCRGFAPVSAAVSTAEPPEGTITVTTVPASDFAHWLWFRQGRTDTLWLLRHGRPWTRWFWRILFGRCGYCGRWDCED